MQIFTFVILMPFYCYIFAIFVPQNKNVIKYFQNILNFFGRITREFSVYGWLSLEILFSDGNIHDIESKIRGSSSDFHRKRFYFELR